MKGFFKYRYFYILTLFVQIQIYGGIKLDSECTLSEQLKDMVCVHLKRHPNLSLNAISTRSGVSGTTLRRIMNSVNSKEPAPHVVLNLVSFIKKERCLTTLLQTTEGEIKKRLNEHFGQFIENHIDYGTTDKLEQILQDPMMYIIYKLTSNHNGTTKEEVQKLYGEVGYSKLIELEQEQLICITHERYHAIKKNFSLSLATAKKHLPHLVSLYKPEELKHQRNIFYSQSEALTIEGIQQIKNIQRNAAVKIHKIMTNDQYKGELPYFSINLGDLLIANYKLEKIETEMNNSKGLLQ